MLALGKTELVHKAETRAPKWILNRAPKLHNWGVLIWFPGCCSMIVGDTPDLGEGDIGVSIFTFGTLGFTLGPRPADTFLASLAPLVFRYLNGKFVSFVKLSGIWMAVKKSLFMVQNVRYLNGPPSQETTIWIPYTQSVLYSNVWYLYIFGDNGHARSMFCRQCSRCTVLRRRSSLDGKSWRRKGWTFDHS